MKNQQEAIRRARYAFMMGCALLFLGNGSTWAAPLAPASVGGQLLFANPAEGVNITTFGTFSLSRATGSLEFTAAGTPTPSLAAQASMVPFFFGRASGSLTYQMEILGPDGDIPVSITASGAVSGSSADVSVDQFAGFAMKSVWSFAALNASPLIQEEGIVTPALTGSFSQSWSETHDLLLTANRTYTITMVADAGARAGAASAFVDPIFSFGPNVDTSLYDFSFSEGIGNSPSAVPAPGGLALTVLMLAVLSRASKRRV